MSMDGFAKGAGECSVTGADKDNFISDLDINLQVDDVVIGINEAIASIPGNVVHIDFNTMKCSRGRELCGELTAPKGAAIISSKGGLRFNILPSPSDSSQLWPQTIVAFFTNQEIVEDVNHLVLPASIMFYARYLQPRITRKLRHQVV
ncbi:hypothetical protein V6N12_007415 [Hibiscus sabdariffa]|uniref:Uncharacterized protein n=1 Tax=Hibiscus sabdariffa TaxID=183260 RepID=A0ABR2F1R3_9ROSI